MPVSKKGVSVTADSITSGTTSTNNGTVVVNTTYIFDSQGGSDIKSLLDGNSNNLTTLNTGDWVLDCIVYTSTAAGSAGTVNIGNDANWNIGSDADSLAAAFDLNTQGSARTVTDAIAGSAGIAVSTGTGNVTIQSTADLSASSWQGGVVLIVAKTIS